LTHIPSPHATVFASHLSNYVIYSVYRQIDATEWFINAIYSNIGKLFIDDIQLGKRGVFSHNIAQRVMNFVGLAVDYRYATNVFKITLAVVASL